MHKHLINGMCLSLSKFLSVYSPDMPKRLPIRDIISGLVGSLGTAIKYWLHYTMIAVAWLGVVPLSAYRIYRCLFYGSLSSVLTLPLDMLSTENIVSDGFYGCCVVTCTLCVFISLVWLREQILRGGGPDWFDQPNQDELGENAVVDDDVVEAGNEVHDDIEEEVDNPHRDPNIVINGDANEPNPDDVVEAAGPMPPENNGANIAQDDMNWNPAEWDRAGEELTWEKVCTVFLQGL